MGSDLVFNIEPLRMRRRAAILAWAAAMVHIPGARVFRIVAAGLESPPVEEGTPAIGMGRDVASLWTASGLASCFRLFIVCL